jgi:hypothetical protein
MVLSRYRILQTKDEQGKWTDAGAVYERTYHDSPLVAVPVAGAGDVKVNWREWNDIARREREYGFFEPSLEEYDKVFADHADRYRLSDEIYTIEGDSYKEIRAKLYQRYVLDPMHEREEVERSILSYEVPERALAGVRAIRETRGDEPCPSD